MALEYARIAEHHVCRTMYAGYAGSITGNRFYKTQEQHHSITMKRCIAIDVMGGDKAPEEVIKGICGYVNSGFSFLLFGRASRISELVKHCLPSGFPCEVIDAQEEVKSDTPVSQALRMSKTSSMGMAIQAVKSGDADAVVSAGNTGAYMALAKIILKTINGIDRPAIASTIPGKDGRSIMLDLGANSECSLRNMVEFAIMGEALAKAVLNKKTPSVSLLNIGSENIKGHTMIRNAAEEIQNICKNYVGYVEGNDIMSGHVDVIVSDGFSGNVALKSIEGTANMLLSILKTAFTSTALGKAAAVLAAKPLKSILKKYDPRIHNGAILIGLNGVVVKSHGNSDKIGTASAVKFAMDVVNNSMLETIKNQLDKTNVLTDSLH